MPINLLPHKEPTFAEKFFSWMLTFGRFIIIGTEMIVLVAFVSRFKLDRDLIDLHDKVQQEESIVKSLISVENRSRSLQKRLFEIGSINQASKNSIAILQEIPALTPENVFLDGLTIYDKGLKIDAKTLSGGGLSDFVKRLRNSNHFSSISLDRITRDETLGGQIKFTITASLVYANSSQ